MSISALASLRRKKIRSLSNTYEQDIVESSIDQTYLFALYSHVCDPIHYEEEIKEDR